jgi:DNA repair protein RecO (recombination protein O)
MLVKDQVIILRATRYGEADLILQVLSRSGRTLSLMAKSALKSRKRFGGGVLEPSHFVRMTYRVKDPESSRMPILMDAELIEGFPGLREDYARLELALYFLQVVEKVCRDGQADARELFDLLGNALRAAEKGINISDLKTVFEIKFLDQQGVLPHEPEYLKVIQHSVKDMLHAEVSSSGHAKERIRDILSGYIG